MNNNCPIFKVMNYNCSKQHEDDHVKIMTSNPARKLNFDVVERELRNTDVDMKDQNNNVNVNNVIGYYYSSSLLHTTLKLKLIIF